MKNCRTTSKKSTFAFEERRSKLTLLNQHRVSTTHVIVDGCERTGNETKKCDYLLFTDDLAIFIELKGQDVSHAIAQIEQTIHEYKSETAKHEKRSYVICSRCPITSTEIQNAQIKHRKNNLGNLIIKSSPHEDAF